MRRRVSAARPPAGWRERVGPRLVRQGLHAALLVALVTGLNAVDWLGFPEARVYVAYVLTEPVDPADVLSRVDALLESFSFDGRWPPWGQKSGGDEPEQERRGAPDAEPPGDGRPDGRPVDEHREGAPVDGHRDGAPADG